MSSIDDYGFISSFCAHCGFILGEFIPGMPCPNCDEDLI
tara:strand:- start:334 stop:450 length:117 start_codon:yes stop_codon:yes gene_type:complete